MRSRCSLVADCCCRCRLPCASPEPMKTGPSSAARRPMGTPTRPLCRSLGARSENIVWKVPIHDRGWSSPLVWGNQIWMTTATADGHQMFAVCVDRETGTTIHDVKVFDTENLDHISVVNSYASPTGVIGGGPGLRPLRHLRHRLPRHRHGREAVGAPRSEMRPPRRGRLVADAVGQPVDLSTSTAATCSTSSLWTRPPATPFGNRPLDRLRRDRARPQPPQGVLHADRDRVGRRSRSWSARARRA